MSNKPLFNTHLYGVPLSIPEPYYFCSSSLQSYPCYVLSSPASGHTTPVNVAGWTLVWPQRYTGCSQMWRMNFFSQGKTNLSAFNIKQYKYPTLTTTTKKSPKQFLITGQKHESYFLSYLKRFLLMLSCQHSEHKELKWFKGYKLNYKCVFLVALGLKRWTQTGQASLYVHYSIHISIICNKAQNKLIFSNF